MKTSIVQTANAPAAIGPYSQGVIHQGLLFTAGQIPLHPQTGEMVGDDITTQTQQVFKNLQAVLTEAGIDFSHVLKATVYLQTMDDFPALNEVYAEYLGEVKPARSTVAVAQLPKGALVEIDLVARVNA